MFAVYGNGAVTQHFHDHGVESLTRPRHNLGTMRTVSTFGVALVAAALLSALGCSGDDDAGQATASQSEPADAPVATRDTKAAEAEPTAERPIEGDEPSIIFFNGHVITIEADKPQAQALAIRGETIIAVGDDADVLALAGAATQIVDLGGRVLLPGFIDPHNHVTTAIYQGQQDELVGTTYDEAQQRLLDAGTTTIANANVSPDELIAIVAFAETGGLRVRLSLYLAYNTNCGERHSEGWYLDHPQISDPAAMLRILGVKFFTDGGGCGQFATSYPPFGDLWMTTEELVAALSQVQADGYQAAIHALGDRELDTALDALETVLDGGPNTSRHRIEHNRLIRPDQLPRYGELGVIPVVFGQPFTCPIVHGGPWSVLKDDDTPAAALRPWFDPWRALLDTNPGLPVAWKSDAPAPFAFEPLTHLWSLVTRNELAFNRLSKSAIPWQPPPDGTLCVAPEWLAAGGVTVDEALRMMTINGAYALFMDEKVGSLAPGKFADLIILSESPLTVYPNELINIEVLMTMVGGNVEYCLPGHESLCP